MSLVKIEFLSLGILRLSSGFSKILPMKFAYEGASARTLNRRKRFLMSIGLHNISL